MAKDKDESAPSTPAAKPAREDVLIVINRLGPYKVFHHAPGGPVIGGGVAGRGDGVRGMVVTEVCCWPGANLETADHVDLIKGNPGFVAKQQANVIEVVPNGWRSLPKPRRLAIAKDTCCPDTLPRLTEIEEDRDVLEILMAQLAISRDPKRDPKAGPKRR